MKKGVKTSGSDFWGPRSCPQACKARMNNFAVYIFTCIYGTSDSFDQLSMKSD